MNSIDFKGQRSRSWGNQCESAWEAVLVYPCWIRFWNFLSCNFAISSSAKFCLMVDIFPGHIISSIQLRSPVTFTYLHHHGPVYSAEFSPFHRNAFLTSAMDQTIRVYSMLQVIKPHYRKTLFIHEDFIFAWGHRDAKINSSQIITTVRIIE